jgi:hypothetical protein
MPKTRQNLPSTGRLGTKQNGKLLIDSAKIIAQSSNPVKLITAQIRYQMLVAKMYRENLARK